MLIEYGNVVTPDTWTLNETKNTGYSRIYYVIESDAIYEDRYGRVELMPNTLYIFPSELPYHAWRTLTGEFSCTYFHDTMITMRIMRIIVQPVHPDTSQYHILQGIRCAIDEDDKGLMSALYNSVEMLYMHDSACRRPSADFVELLNYISSHLNEELSIDLLSSKMHFHPHYFIKAFRSEVGCSPHQYIRNLRMHEAARYLQEDVPITEVAKLIGYNNVSSFSRAYKAFWGGPPSDHNVWKNIP